MSTFDETNVRRQPQGVTTGGQFATQPKSEPDVALDEAAPVPLAQAVPPHDSGDALYIYEDEHGDPVFDTITVMTSEDGTFYAEGNSKFLCFLEGVGRHADKLGLDADDEDAIGEYLTTREHIITEWFEKEYGVHRLEVEDWDTSFACFSTDLPADADTAGITDALRLAGKPVELHNESDPGTYGTRDMWRALAERLAADDERAKRATTTITWRRRFPVAVDSETWKAEVPISLLRDVDSGRARKSDLDQYVCDNGEATDRGTASRDGSEYDEVHYDFVDRSELRPIYHLVPEQD